MQSVGKKDMQKFEEYTGFVNYVLASLMFSMGISCLGFDNINDYVWFFSKKEFYSVLISSFSCLLLISYHKNIKQVLQTLFDNKHPYYQKWQLIKRFMPWTIAQIFEVPLK
jgi:hypothetical protein